MRNTPSPHTRAQCSGLDGTYLNLGLGRQALEDELIQVRLDVALGHASPTLEMPSEVSIRFDAEHDVLNYDFHGTVDESYSTSARCSDGWYTWTRTITDKYVGDGANLDYSIREIKVANASDGDLIVHLALDTQFSSFGILKSQYKRETWSKFQAIKSPD